MSLYSPEQLRFHADPAHNRLATLDQAIGLLVAAIPIKDKSLVGDFLTPVSQKLRDRLDFNTPYTNFIADRAIGQYIAQPTPIDEVTQTIIDEHVGVNPNLDFLTEAILAVNNAYIPKGQINGNFTQDPNNN